MASYGSITINCHYEYFGTSPLSKIYTCLGTIVSCGEGCSDLVEVRGSHLQNRSNEDVEGLFIQEQQLKNFPANVTFFFPNIRHIDLQGNVISEIKMTHLEQFGAKLNYLNLKNNVITSIDEDIFKHSFGIASINFDGNNIRYITEALTFPSSIQYLNFEHNECIDEIYDGKSDANTIIDAIIINCSHGPRIGSLERYVTSMDSLLLKSNEKILMLEDVIQNLKDIFNEK